MATQHDIEPGQRIDLTAQVVGISWTDRHARLVDQNPGRPPNRIDGFTIGAPELTCDPSPHKGEMHPDGDEVLYLVSGAATLRLELPEGEQHIDLGPGDAIVVPKGVWHLITTREPGRLIHITPGPNGEARH